VKERADYVSSVNGGSGAVRDIIEYMLRQRGEWESVTAKVYGIGV
jgi:3-deoxy-D-manno-octulosonate 8-phosphate phosphatase (KDO 8-P phosphatase)